MIVVSCMQKLFERCWAVCWVPLNSFLIPRGAIINRHRQICTWMQLAHQPTLLTSLFSLPSPGFLPGSQFSLISPSWWPFFILCHHFSHHNMFLARTARSLAPHSPQWERERWTEKRRIKNKMLPTSTCQPLPLVFESVCEFGWMWQVLWSDLSGL